MNFLLILPCGAFVCVCGGGAVPMDQPEWKGNIVGPMWAGGKYSFCIRPPQSADPLLVCLSSPSQDTLLHWALAGLGSTFVSLERVLLWANAAPGAYEVGSTRHLCTKKKAPFPLDRPSSVPGARLSQGGWAALLLPLCPQLGPFGHCTAAQPWPVSCWSPPLCLSAHSFPCLGFRLD